MSEVDVSQLQHDRLKVVFRHAPIAISVTVLNALLTAIVLASVDNRTALAAWVIAIGIVSAARWWCGRTFLRIASAEPASARRWGLLSSLGALTTGVLWGLAATALFPASESHQLFLALVIAGMCAGAVTVNAAHLPTVLGFVLPSCLPLAASFLEQGAAGRLSALMIVIFAASLTIIALTAHRAFGDSIRLKLALDRQHRHLVEANTQLVEAVTQRRMAEATLHQAQKMEAIGHLTGGLAHDFNNLLQVMIGNMDLIRRLGADNPRIVRYAEAAEQAAFRGAELTSSLLTFARRQTLDAEPIDVNRLLREFEPILLRTLGANIRFDINLTPELPPCLADPAHFQSAVLNLVINARDAMLGGGALALTTRMATLGVAELKSNHDAKPGCFVGVTVQDTGVGMNEVVLARVFEPFFTTKAVGKGTGLGLSQVYGFARQSRGHIHLDSAPGEGTVATLWLPVAPAAGGTMSMVTATENAATRQKGSVDRSGLVQRSLAEIWPAQGPGPHRGDVQAFQ